MLSYQHAYHAGNMADVHKHAALAWMLDYLTRKDKPLSYIETHAGRGLYDLAGPEARKTAEAAQGITRSLDAFGPTHPFRRALEISRARHGPTAYPGSPLIAATLLRPKDRLHLAELHPAEHAALTAALRAPNVTVYRQDGLALAMSLVPPTPRRGLMLIDPSWEVKADYAAMPDVLAKLNHAWNVGVIVLWYPVLTALAPHLPMIAALEQRFPEALRHEIAFPPARPGHGMTGSGLFVVNPPFGLAQELADLSRALPIN